MTDKKPGMLELKLRGGKSPAKAARWDPAETAAVVCDMWNHHWCRSAERRVGEMAPRMNRLLHALRDRGVLICHCPSDTMKFYAKHPGRAMALAAPAVKGRVKIPSWRHLNPRHEGPIPIDDSDNGCDCKPTCPAGEPYPWTRQIEALDVLPGDAIGDKAEIPYLLHERGIRNVLVMGVHLNFCVLGRPFGIRQLVYLRRHVALVRDMTDTMYNPAMPPHVSHFQGTELMVRHVEKYWCPTVTSDQFLGGEPFHFRGDAKRTV